MLLAEWNVIDEKYSAASSVASRRTFAGGMLRVDTKLS